MESCIRLLTCGCPWSRRKPPLIMARTAPTEPKSATAGVMLKSSLARFMASVTTFNDERTLSQRRWALGPLSKLEVAARRRHGTQSMNRKHAAFEPP